MSFGLRLVLALGVVSGAVFACNAIVGVDDVRLRTVKGATNDDGGGINPGGGDEGGTVGSGTDHGELAMGQLHVCGRLTTGAVKCWGDNGAGQLGDGLDFASTARVDPAKVPQSVPNLSGVVSIGSGTKHTCAAKNDGSVVCWGINDFGQLGNDTMTRSSSPVPVAQLDHAVAVAAGGSFSCALKDDKTVMCWGANYSGQLGNGDDAGSPSAQLHAVAVAGLSNIVGISAGTVHACAVDGDGGLWCWGSNFYGQLGNGSTNGTSTPVKLTSLTGVGQVSAGNYFTCAALKSGKVYCWGVNDNGQLGNGTQSNGSVPNPSPIAVPLNDATFLWTAGTNHVCAVRQSGSVACWGDSSSGQLGYSATVDGSVPSPVQVATITNGFKVWTGGDTSCAIASDGRAYCWGSNSDGQIGDKTTVTRFTPTQVSSFP